ncbi:hypothetical protein F2Q69_00028062 [Brassica cretica]|uniref:Uncharacterized protein n=1 Tax=Brassica cretica TaxID=69181 RepID=A0A8S9RTL2_BRACR|nr:hypothetical protein F2Q69_00028062 [Brassica cretica]
MEAGLLAVEIAPEGILGSDPCVRITDHMFVCWNILSLMILIIRNCWLSTLVLVRQAVCDLIMGKDGRPDPWMMDQGSDGGGGNACASYGELVSRA